MTNKKQSTDAAVREIADQGIKFDQFDSADEDQHRVTDEIAFKLIERLG